MAGSSKKVVFAALAGNTLIALTKFGAAALTGSSAMLSEAIHSLVDTGNQGLLLLGMRRAQKPPDKQFPFGYGKELYFWSFVVALLIFALGAGISIYEGIHGILHPGPIENPVYNYVVIGCAILFEGLTFVVATTEFRKVKGDLGYVQAIRLGKDPSMFTVLFEDSAALLGLFVALVGIVVSQTTHWYYADGIASLCIGVILGVVAVMLALETKGLLVGEAARSEVVEGIERIVLSDGNVTQINELLTMHIGPEFILVNVSVDFDDTCDATDVEDTVSRLDQQIKNTYPKVKRVFIEAEAWKGRRPQRQARLTGEFEPVPGQREDADQSGDLELNEEVAQ